VELRGRGALKAEINVTPLVDVVLVLLIIFMVVTPMLTRGRNVQLPIASTVETEREVHDALVLTVTADRRLFLENRPVTIASLAAAIGPRIADRRDASVLIKADSSVSVRDLRPVLRLLKSQKVQFIAFAVLEQRAAQ
jgi:biopolymer transport protein ExbD/biopolymer transport protein TolR